MMGGATREAAGRFAKRDFAGTLFVPKRNVV